MEYSAGGLARLDEAKRRARELLDEMDPASSVAVLDTGEDAGERLGPRSDALARLEGLRLRPANAPLNRPIARAAALLAALGEGEDVPPRFLYVFSDRTRASWDPSTAPGMKVPPGAQTVFVDVGIDSPRDLAIDKVEVAPPVVSPGEKVEVRVTVRATGADQENELAFQIDNDPDPDRPVERRPVQLGKGQTDVIVFERRAPPLPPGGADTAYQVSLRLSARDALPFNNARFATFLVRGPRKLLTIVQSDPKVARMWKLAHDSPPVVFRCEVKTLAEAGKLSAKGLAEYRVICIFQLPDPPDELWKKLAGWVGGGGGLAIVPGGEECMPAREEFNRRGLALGLLPAPLEGLVDAPKGRTLWAPFRGEHPVTARFLQWMREGDFDFARSDVWPFVRRYWRLGTQAKGADAIATLRDRQKSPALAERLVGKGKVVLFSTPLDTRLLGKNQPAWHNYWSDSSFGVILIDRVCQYLAGEATTPELNFLCGQVPHATAPAPFTPPYTLQGPGLAGGERSLKPPSPAGRVDVPQAQTPGQFAVLDVNDQVAAAFSVNARPEESDLDRVAVADLEAVLGEGSVLAVGRTASLADALASAHPPPVELLPYLMLGLLAFLSVEGLLANHFFRRDEGRKAKGEGEEASGTGTGTG
jgi:hypothetical protein